MAVTSAGSSSGVLAVLRLPTGSAADQHVSTALEDANRRLKYHLVGTTSYASFLAGSLTQDEDDAIHAAANLIAAGYVLGSLPGATGDRGVLTSEAIGDGASNAYLTPDEAAKAGRMLRERAIRLLDQVSLYSRTTIQQLTLVQTEEEET